MVKSGRKRQHSYETRVGACADYLIGLPADVIEHKWGVANSLVCYWILQRGCFKLRRTLPLKPNSRRHTLYKRGEE
jgi:hypothetical protein